MQGEIDLASEPGRTVFTLSSACCLGHRLSGARVSCQDRQRVGRRSFDLVARVRAVSRGSTIAVVALVAAVLGGVVSLLVAKATGLIILTQISRICHFCNKCL